MSPEATTLLEMRERPQLDPTDNPTEDSTVVVAFNVLTFSEDPDDAAIGPASD